MPVSLAKTALTIHTCIILSDIKKNISQISIDNLAQTSKSRNSFKIMNFGYSKKIQVVEALLVAFMDTLGYIHYKSKISHFPTITKCNCNGFQSNVTIINYLSYNFVELPLKLVQKPCFRYNYVTLFYVHVCILYLFCKLKKQK